MHEHMTCDDGYAAALAVLTWRESRALLALGTKRDWDRDDLLLWRRARSSQAMRREMVKSLSSAEVKKLREKMERVLGSTTRPVDRLSPLCWKLRDPVGLSYQEIVDLLDATELEKRPVDDGVDGGAAKIQRRVDRFKKRLSPEELKKLRAGIDRTLGARCMSDESGQPGAAALPEPTEISTQSGAVG